MKAGRARPDHYATLGVDPAASAADVRAAYVTLLREHHPDRNHSPEAVDRTKAIIAAFKVVGDFDQRNYYDWDRRRDREAAEAAAAGAPRRRARAGTAAAGMGLAAAGAWLLLPQSIAEPPASTRGTGALLVQQATTPARNAAARSVGKEVIGATIIRTKPALAGVGPRPRATDRSPRESQKPAADRPTRKPVERTALFKADPPPPSRATKESTAPDPVRLAAKTVPPARPSPTRATTDLASLDQFVMNFYGQSWRFGDAPKRDALEQTRAGFVVRRGNCVGESCKRDAYLRLMRDVSAIVETGKPTTR